MEIRDRIESCLSALDARWQEISAFEVKVGAVIKALRAGGETPGALGEVLAVLEGVLANYREISLSCRQMIEGLREIGDHLDRIEDGRKKIVTGVETILANLERLDEIAKQGLQLGVGGAPETGSGRPRRVLLIRIRPDTGQAAEPAVPDRPEPDLLDEEDAEPGGVDGLTVH